MSKAVELHEETACKYIFGANKFFVDYFPIDFNRET